MILLSYLDFCREIGLLPLKNLLQQFSELISASSSSEEGNLKVLREKAEGAMSEYEWVVVPLMMDIYYMYADPLKKGEWPKEPKDGVRVDDAELQKDWDEILE